MKILPIALLAVGGFILYNIAQLGVAGATIQILLNGVTVNSVTNYTVQLLVQNVSNANISLRSLTADIQLNGNDIGNASFFPVDANNQPVPVVIPGNSQQVVNLTINPSLLNLPASIIALINNPTGNQNFTVSGNANVDSFVIPFSVSKDISLGTLV